MSDLYLVLRSRLEAVPEWVFIDTAVLRAGRERKGLSYEAMGRELHVSSKTWERHEKQGRVPRPLVPAVAATLDLEIEEPVRQRVVVEPGRSIEERLTTIEAKVDELLTLIKQRHPGPEMSEEELTAGARAAAVEAGALARGRGRRARDVLEEDEATG